MLRGRDRTIFDWKQRLSREPVKKEDVTSFGNLRNSVAPMTVVLHGNEIGINRQVVIPEIVAQCLKMPKAASGSGIQTDGAIGKQIVPFATAAPKIRGGGPRADQNQ